MRSVLDDAKKVTTIEVLSDHHEKETSEVVPIDHHEKKTSEIVSEIEIVTVSEKETNEVVLSGETSEVVSDDHHEKKTSEIVTEIEIVTVSEKETNEIILSEEKTNDQIEILPDQTQRNNPRVVFVLGGPGGGKSTQCANLAKQIGFTHLSSGELLREARQCDSKNGPMIEGMMKEGKSVPPDVTMRILQKAIDESGNDKFLLDGFPRDEEIRSAFESASQIEPELVLLFNCSEEEREKRIHSRKQERVDDNPDTLRKRFKYFEEHTLPVVEYYRSKGKVTEIDAAKPMEEVFEKLKSILNPSSLQEETTAAHCKLGKEMLNLKL